MRIYTPDYFTHKQSGVDPYISSKGLRRFGHFGIHGLSDGNPTPWLHPEQKAQDVNRANFIL